MSEEQAKLFGALSKAQAEMPVIGKNRKAKAGSFSYAYVDINDVLRVALPVLSRHGLSVFQGMRDGLMTTTIAHEAGGFVSDGGIPVPVNPDPQKMGSAITYMRRYGLCCMLGIAADEDIDGAGGEGVIANDTPASTLPDKYAPINSTTPGYHRIVTAIWGCLGVAVDPNLNPWNEIEAMGQGDVLDALEGLPALKATMRDSPDVKACNMQERQAIGQLFTDIEAALNGRTEEDAA